MINSFLSFFSVNSNPMNLAKLTRESSSGEEEE